MDGRAISGRRRRIRTAEDAGRGGDLVGSPRNARARGDLLDTAVRRSLVEFSRRRGEADITEPIEVSAVLTETAIRPTSSALRTWIRCEVTSSMPVTVTVSASGW
ncbi:hypothetical protein ACFQX7_31045 [Luedemannella flava]